MNFTFYMPTQVHFGQGVFARAGELAARLGRHALVVTARTAMDRLGFTARLLADLEAHGVAATVFRDLRPGPTTEEVDRGAERARRSGSDLVIALGGGSALDGAKAIAAIAPANRPAADFLYQRVQPGPATLPILAIPTTAGTGSETNRSALLTDVARLYKEAIRSDWLFPRHALVDPELTYDLPPRETALTGFDTLAHAVESYVSPRANPIADGLALAAVEAVRDWLPVALEQPHHPQARAQLLHASMTMGVNLSCVGTCFPHRADKALCALHPEIPHGQSVAIFYPLWARWSQAGAPARFARLAALLDPRDQHSFEVVIRRLLARLGLAHTLRDLGVRPEERSTLVENIAGDLSINPVPVRREELPALLDQVFQEGSRS